MLVGILGTLVFFLFIPRIRTLLDISSTVPLVLLGLCILPVTGLPAITGTLQGLQRFYLFGVLLIIGPFFRLISAATLTRQGWGLNGGAVALLLHPTISFIVGCFLLRAIWNKGRTHEVHGHHLLGFSFRTAFGLLCLAFLTNIDVVVVRSSFAGVEAGRYCAVATLGKSILYLSTAVTTILFPKTVEHRTLKRESKRMVRRSLCAVALISLAVTGVFFLLYSRIIGGLFGVGYLTDRSLLGLYGLAMTSYALVGVWFYYYLGVGHSYYVCALLVGAVVQWALLKLFGTSLLSVVVVLIGMGFSLYLVGHIITLSKVRCTNAGQHP